MTGPSRRELRHPRPKEFKMRKRNIALLLAVAAPAMAVLLSSCTAHNPPNSNMTVRCTENLTGVDVTNGGVAGTGHCAITGVLHDSGPTTDYRSASGTTVTIRRVITGAKGTITFVITIPTVGPPAEPWTITSGTKAYSKLHGRGFQVVDNYQGSPATFVLKGTVSHAQA